MEKKSISTQNNSNELSEQELTNLAIKKASQEGLVEFSCVVDAKYDPQWFHKEIADKLEEVYARVKKGESPRVMIFMPPRHGKSDLATQKYPAWLLGKEPTWPIIVASYSQDLATNFGQGTRDLMENGNYKYLFNTRLRADTSAKANWMTDKGGGYLAVGVGGSITGKGFKVGIVDDPFKNREEADSPVVRESVWKWYASTFGTREEGASAIIVILTRWHDDDLAGRLLRQQAESEKSAAEYYDKWEVLEYKAIAEQDEPHRKASEALWPDKFSYEKLMTKKNSMGSYEWSALYQQNPIDIESQEFKKEWIQYRSWEDIQKMTMRKFVTIDPAGSKKKESDSTGVTRNYVNDKNEWNIKTRKYRINSKQIIDLIFELHDEGFEKIGIEQGVYSEAIEPFFMDEKEKRNVYPNVIPLKHGGTMKETRIRGLIPRYENKKIWHISGFCDDLEEEYLRFPKSAHDDCLDSLAYQSHLAGQFSQGSSDFVDEYDISKNVMELVNEQAGTVIIGVSTTSPCNYVIGNKESLFFHRTSEDWSREIDYYLRALPETGKPRWDNCIIIADQVGDSIGFNNLKDKYKGKIYFVELQKDKLNKEPVTFLAGKEFGKIEADKNRLLQQTIDEFKDKRIPMYGKLSDWEPIYSQWSKLHRVWDKNAQGDPVATWETDAPQGFIKAILYWRIGMDKFGRDKGGFLGAREDLFPNKGEVFKLGGFT